MGSVDAEACAVLLSKQALEVGIKTNLDNARNRVQQICIDMISTAKGGDKRTVSGYTVPQQQKPGDEGDQSIPDCLQLLPLYTLAILKNVAFRGGTDVHPDERIASHMALRSMFVKDLLSFIHPRLYAIHDIDDQVGLPSDDDDDEVNTAGREKIVLPGAINLSVERLSSEGVFLLDNGVDAFIWVGRASNPAIVSALFGVESLENVDPSQLKLNSSGNDVASRLNTIIQALHEEDDPSFSSVTPSIHIIREGDMAMEARFFWNFIEDRAQFNGGTYSYAEFMEFCKKAPGSAGPPGPGMGRGGPPAPPGPGRMPPAPRQPMAPGPPAPPGSMPGRGMPPPPHQPMAPGPPGPMPGRGMPPGPPGPPGPGYGMPGPPMSGPPSSGGPPPMPGAVRGPHGAPNFRPSGPPSHGMPPPVQPAPISNGSYVMPPHPGSAPPSSGGFGMPPPGPAPTSGYGGPPPPRQYGMPPPPRTE